jgi:hypothetical protein
MAQSHEKPTQLTKCFEGYLRLSELHPPTCDRIEHPGGDHNDVARLDLNVNEHTRGTRLTVVAPYSATVQRMPAVLDDGGLPDMGRMTVRLLWEERTTTARSRSAAPRWQPSCTA